MREIKHPFQQGLLRKKVSISSFGLQAAMGRNVLRFAMGERRSSLPYFANRIFFVRTP